MIAGQEAEPDLFVLHPGVERVAFPDFSRHGIHVLQRPVVFAHFAVAQGAAEKAARGDGLLAKIKKCPGKARCRAVQKLGADLVACRIQKGGVVAAPAQPVAGKRHKVLRLLPLGRGKKSGLVRDRVQLVFGELFNLLLVVVMNRLQRIPALLKKRPQLLLAAACRRIGLLHNFRKPADAFTGFCDDELLQLEGQLPPVAGVGKAGADKIKGCAHLGR